MTLTEYTSTVMTQAQLAQRIGAYRSDLSRWARGQRKVPARFASAIERATQGLVSRADLRPHDYWLIWPDMTAPEAV